jgi:hypothetical protein
MTDARRVGSYAELSEVLARLGSVEDGHVRVFRGQNRAYLDENTGLHTITPALARNRERYYNPEWLVRVANDLHRFGSSRDGPMAPTPDLTMFWAPALVQHYGPGSFFVDVTTDVDTALWFALHQATQARFVFHLGSADVGVVPWHQAIASYSDVALPIAAAGRPVLYVFDVPVWAGAILPKFGELVDLRTVSAGVGLAEEATRLHRQHGCLLHARPALGSGDVGPLARLAIELGDDFDVSSVPGIDRSTTTLFPSPDEDSVYALLMLIPGQLRFEPTRVESPLKMPWYVDDPSIPDRECDRFIPCCRFARPTLLHAELDAELEISVATTTTTVTASLRDTLAILLQGPLFTSTPAVEVGEKCSWIESALPFGISGDVDGISTQSAYIELASVDFFDARADGGVSLTVPRAIWVVRNHPFYAVRTFWHHDTEAVEQHHEFRYDEGLGAFVCDGRTPAVANDLVVKKCLFLTLALLRDLSPGCKPPVLFFLSRRQSDGSWDHLPAAPFIARRARLRPIARGRYYTVESVEGTSYTLGVRPDDAAQPVNDADYRNALALARKVKHRSYVDYVDRLLGTPKA